MNLGMILNAPYPADMRVKKETAALLNAGINVHLLCLRKSGEPYSGIVDGISVSRIDAGKSNFQLALRDAMMSITFIHPEFARAIPAWAAANGINVIHVHDLPLAGTALAWRKKAGGKVVLDMHENYPDALRTWFEWKKGLLVKVKNRIFMNPDRWTKMERKAVLASDAVIAVVDEMKTRLLQQYQTEPGKVIVVSNTEEKSFHNQPVDPKIYGAMHDKFKILYAGGIGPHRGIDTAIHAMKYLTPFPEISLIIIGTGSNDVMRHLKRMASDLNVHNNVHFLGHQPFQKFYSYMHLADVNIIPHKSNPHTDNTIPHKLFQSMMSGKPLLVSSSAPLKRIVGQTGCGLIFNAGDAQDLAGKALELFQNPALGSTLGQRGILATIDKDLNWENDQKKLVDFYSRLLTE